MKNREEFEGELEKRKGKGGERRKKEKSDKTHIRIPLFSLNDRKQIHKNREELLRGGGFLAGQNIYTRYGIKSSKNRKHKSCLIFYALKFPFYFFLVPLLISFFFLESEVAQPRKK